MDLVFGIRAVVGFWQVDRPCSAAGSRTRVFGVSLPSKKWIHGVSWRDFTESCEGFEPFGLRKIPDILPTFLKTVAVAILHAWTICVFGHTKYIQESLSNAKVSVRQFWYIGPRNMQSSVKIPRKIELIAVHFYSASA